MAQLVTSFNLLIFTVNSHALKISSASARWGQVKTYLCSDAVLVCVCVHEVCKCFRLNTHERTDLCSRHSGSAPDRQAARMDGVARREQQRFSVMRVICFTIRDSSQVYMSAQKRMKSLCVCVCNRECVGFWWKPLGRTRQSEYVILQ